MSETYLRQWSMLRKIPKKPRKIASSTILKILEDEGYKVSKRTIERDLNALALVFPIDCDDRSKPFGWQWVGNDVLDIPSMDIPVALTFSLASQFLEPLLPRSSHAHLAPHFRQAEIVLNNTEKSGQGKWLDKIRVLHKGQRLIAVDVMPEILDVVYEALLEDKRIDITYQKTSDSEPKEYEVNPLGLVFRDATIYLVSSLWEYDDIKQLVLHRIMSASIADRDKKIPKGFNLDDYIKSGEFEYRVSDKIIKLKVLFDSNTVNHLRETKLSEDQVISDRKDGKVLLEASVIDTIALRQWLMGFGAEVEVIKPKSLRDEFKEASKNLINLYS